MSHSRLINDMLKFVDYRRALNCDHLDEEMMELFEIDEYSQENCEEIEATEAGNSERLRAANITAIGKLSLSSHSYLKFPEEIKFNLALLIDGQRPAIQIDIDCSYGDETGEIQAEIHTEILEFFGAQGLSERFRWFGWYDTTGARALDHNGEMRQEGRGEGNKVFQPNNYIYYSARFERDHMVHAQVLRQMKLDIIKPNNIVKRLNPNGAEMKALESLVGRMLELECTSDDLKSAQNFRVTINVFTNRSNHMFMAQMCTKSDQIKKIKEKVQSMVNVGQRMGYAKLQVMVAVFDYDLNLNTKKDPTVYIDFSSVLRQDNTRLHSELEQIQQTLSNQVAMLQQGLAELQDVPGAPQQPQAAQSVP